MKFARYIIIYFLISTILQNDCFSQTVDRDLYNKYINSRSLYNGDYPYVYSYTTLGGKMIQHSMYYKKDSHYVLALFQSDSDFVLEKKFDADVLFELVDSNLNYLKRIRDVINVPGGKNKKRFADTVIPFTQIGIRYKDLHYNHYQQSALTFLEGIKKEELKTGYQAVNRMAAFFETQSLIR